jgi:hypothetical protein
MPCCHGLYFMDAQVCIHSSCHQCCGLQGGDPFDMFKDIFGDGDPFAGMGGHGVGQRYKVQYSSSGGRGGGTEQVFQHMFRNMGGMFGGGMGGGGGGAHPHKQQQRRQKTEKGACLSWCVGRYCMPLCPCLQSLIKCALFLTLGRPRNCGTRGTPATHLSSSTPLVGLI